MVMIEAPSTVPTATTQERIASPLTCTVQAPHCAMPQPNLVPVRPNSSRNTHRQRRLRLDIELVRGPVDLERYHDLVPLRRGSGAAGRRRARCPLNCGRPYHASAKRQRWMDGNVPPIEPNGRRFLTRLEAWVRRHPCAPRRSDHRNERTAGSEPAGVFRGHCRPAACLLRNCNLPQVLWCSKWRVPPNVGRRAHRKRPSFGASSYLRIRQSCNFR